MRMVISPKKGIEKRTDASKERKNAGSFDVHFSQGNICNLVGTP